VQVSGEYLLQAELSMILSEISLLWQNWVENLNDAVKLANPKTMPQNQKLWLCLVYDRSYDNLKNFLIFSIGVIVFFDLFE